MDKKKDKRKFKIIPKTNEEYISVTNGCIELVDSYRFLSSSLDKIVETLVDNSHKSLKIVKKKFIGDDNILKIVNEKEKLLGKDENNKTIEKLKKVNSDKFYEVEGALLNYMGESDLKISKTGFPDKWKYLTKKLAYPCEYFTSIDDYQKPVNTL